MIAIRHLRCAKFRGRTTLSLLERQTQRTIILYEQSPTRRTHLVHRETCSWYINSTRRLSYQTLTNVGEPKDITAVSITNTNTNTSFSRKQRRSASRIIYNVLNKNKDSVQEYIVKRMGLEKLKNSEESTWLDVISTNIPKFCHKWNHNLLKVNTIEISVLLDQISIRSAQGDSLDRIMAHISETKKLLDTLTTLKKRGSTLYDKLTVYYDAQKRKNEFMETNIKKKTKRRSSIDGTLNTTNNGPVDSQFIKVEKKYHNLNVKRKRLRSELKDLQEDPIHQMFDKLCVVFSEFLISENGLWDSLDSHTELTRPQEWYPYARLSHRKIIYHGGPTNSGKTYEALQRLKQAKRGLYLGPLRLLAAEVYEKLTLEGIYCNYVTGQDKRIVPFATHTSATVEIASQFEEYDVVVIDEIQMIADPERGHAWTRALLGMRSPEIHVCGGLEALDLVERMVKSCGDEFEIRKYARFSSLTVEENSLATSVKEKGCYSRVMPGDCIVAFNVKDLFAIKREIERLTSHKCCLIFGTLPPETRSKQAKMFNDPHSGYDILVATDAVGMGLNLNIRRIVFHTVYKFKNSAHCMLDHSAVKQISGRAGRRNSPYEYGMVTCRVPDDMQYIRSMLSKDIEPINSAGLLPTNLHMEAFSMALQKLGYEEVVSDVKKLFDQYCKTVVLKDSYFVCHQKSFQILSDKIARFDLPIGTKLTICMAPVPALDSAVREVTRFLRKVAKGEVAGLSSQTIPRRPKSFENLKRLCDIYAEIDLFLWLQLKFPPMNAIEHGSALNRRMQALALINKSLRRTEALQLDHDFVQSDLKIRQLFSGSKKNVISVTEKR